MAEKLISRRPDMNMATRKTYFLIDLKNSKNIGNGVYENEFPPEFINARGDKWVEIRYCFALTEKGYLVADMVLHSDLIKRDGYLDNTVSVINVLNHGAKPDKYLIPEGSSKYFRIWFSKLNGDKVEQIDGFQMKMLLIYNE